jgi:hypothetical protein
VCFVGCQLRGNSVNDNEIFFTRRFSYLKKNVFTNLTWFHFNAYIYSQINRTWSSGNPRALRENPLHSPESVFGAQCLEKELWDHFSVKALYEGLFSASDVIELCFSHA